MLRSKRKGMFAEVAVRSMQDALYEPPIDRCWDELQEVFERPDVKEAEAVIMQAIAEAFAPNGKKTRRRKKT